MVTKISEWSRKGLYFFANEVISLDIPRLSDIAKIYYFTNLGLIELFSLLKYQKSVRFLSQWQFTQAIRVLNGVAIIYKVSKLCRDWLNPHKKTQRVPFKFSNLPSKDKSLQNPTSKKSQAPTNTASSASLQTTTSNTDNANEQNQPEKQNDASGENWKLAFQICNLLSDFFLIIKSPFFSLGYKKIASNILLCIPNVVNFSAACVTRTQVNKDKEVKTIESLIDSLKNIKMAIAYCNKLHSLQKHLMEQPRIELIRDQLVNPLKDGNFQNVNQLIETDADLKELKLGDLKNQKSSDDSSNLKILEDKISKIKIDVLRYKMKKKLNSATPEDEELYKEKSQSLRKISSIYFEILGFENLSREALNPELGECLKNWINTKILCIQKGENRLLQCTKALWKDHRCLLDSIASEILYIAKRALEKKQDIQTLKLKQLYCIRDFLIIQERISFCHAITMHFFSLKFNKIHNINQFNLHIKNQTHYINMIGKKLMKKMQICNFNPNIIEKLKNALKICGFFEKVTNENFELFEPDKEDSNKSGAFLVPVYDTNEKNSSSSSSSGINKSDSSKKGIIEYETYFNKKKLEFKVVKYDFVKKLDELISDLQIERTNNKNQSLDYLKIMLLAAQPILIILKKWYNFLQNDFSKSLGDRMMKILTAFITILGTLRPLLEREDIFQTAEGLIQKSGFFSFKSS